MKTESAEGELRDVFQELRRRDAATAPSFEQVLNRRPIHMEAAPYYRVAFCCAAAAMLLVVAAVTLFRPAGHHAAEVDKAVLASLVDWQASTDNLLTLNDSPFDDALTSGTDELLDASSIIIEAQFGERETL